jgi:type II secretory pathway pseudopilin PulG
MNPPPFPISPLPSPTLPRASRGKAFTLIELMVAAGITTLLLLGMTGIFDQAMKAWRLSSRRADAEREVRAALTQIQRDLSCMVVNPNLPIAYNQSRISGQFINVASSGFQLTVANHPPKSGPQGQDWSNASVVLFFATTGGAGQGNSGDLSGVGYFVTWDPSSNLGRGAWNLYRRYQRPADLLAGLQARIANPNLGPYHINTLSEPELIGANVFNFFAQPVNILTNSGGTNTNMVSYASLQAGTNLTVRPRYMQLELTAYGSEQVQGFQKADWVNTNNIAKFGRSFIWRVDL